MEDNENKGGVRIGTRTLKELASWTNPKAHNWTRCVIVCGNCAYASDGYKLAEVQLGAALDGGPVAIDQEAVQRITARDEWAEVTATETRLGRARIPHAVVELGRFSQDQMGRLLKASGAPRACTVNPDYLASVCKLAKVLKGTMRISCADTLTAVIDNCQHEAQCVVMPIRDARDAADRLTA